tara:strand:- start:3167 stop:3430 length:264 start_codon:yes stop_codon:yes gene_type:complete
MVKESSDIYKDIINWESESKSKDKLVKDLGQEVNGSKIISYANIVEELKRLNKQNEKYADKINDLFYRANSLQDEAVGLVDEINDVV